MADAAPPTEPRPAEQAALAVFVGAALAVFGLSRAVPIWPLLLLLPLVTVRLRVRGLPARLVAASLYAVRALLLTTVVVGFSVALYPVIAEGTTTAIIRAGGGGLAAFASLFLLATPVFAPTRGVVPATLGLLVAVAVDARESPLGGLETALLLLAFGAVTAWLFVSARPVTVGARRGPWFSARLGVFAGGALAIAIGIVRLLPWAQPKVESAAAGLFAENSGRSYSGLSAQSRLGDIEELALSPRIVLRVWSSEPQYLRARVLTTFDGRRWSAPRAAEVALDRAPPPGDSDLRAWLEEIPGTTFTAGPADAGEGLVRSRLVPAVSSLPLVAPPRARLLRAPVPVRATRAGVLNAMGTAEIYGVANAGTIPADLASSTEDETTLAQALSVPTILDPRLPVLAAELSRGGATPRERLLRTIRHFQSNFRYSLKVGAFRTQDPIGEFVFDKKRGYCEYFASAAALLLRLQGVPTRYVTGFSVRSANFTAGHYLVREADAHAWIETYLPGQGWVEADPTPAADYDELHAALRGGPFSASLEWLKARWAEVMARFSSAGLRAALLWLGRELGQLAGRIRMVPLALSVGLILALIAGRHWWRRRRRATASDRGPRESVPADLQELIQRLDRAWARRGCPRPPSRAPLEHVRDLPPEKASPALRALATELVGSVYGVLFAGQAFSAADGVRLRRLAEKIEQEPLGARG